MRKPPLPEPRAGAARPAGGSAPAFPAGSGRQRELPFQGRVKGKEGMARAGAVVSRELPACLPEVSLTFSVVSLPDRGRRVRYGKLRSDLPRSLAAKDARPAKPELARPLAISSLPLAPPADKEAPFHPPRSTPSLGDRREPCFRLLPAFGKSREDRFLPASPSRVSHGPCALTRRARSCLHALTPRAFSEPRVSGGRASGNNQRKRRLPARGLGASRRSVEAVRGGELREVTSGRKAPGRFSRGRAENLGP